MDLLMARRRKPSTHLSSAEAELMSVAQAAGEDVGAAQMAEDVKKCKNWTAVQHLEWWQERAIAN